MYTATVWKLATSYNTLRGLRYITIIIINFIV